MQKTNPTANIDVLNLQSLVDRGIGLVIGIREYYGKDGSLKEALDVQDFCTASDVRSGNLPREPEIKEPKNAPPTPAMEEIQEETGLPF